MNFMCVDVPAGMNMNITAVWFFKVSWKKLNIFTSATPFFSTFILQLFMQYLS